jgi:hypothetical protein
MHFVPQHYNTIKLKRHHLDVKSLIDASEISLLNNHDNTRTVLDTIFRELLPIRES